MRGDGQQIFAMLDPRINRVRCDACWQPGPTVSEVMDEKWDSFRCVCGAENTILRDKIYQLVKGET